MLTYQIVSSLLCYIVLHCIIYCIIRYLQADDGFLTLKMFDYLVVQYSKEFKDEIEDDSDGALPLKHELISCLSVGGRWITSQSNLQVSIILLLLRINRRGIVASGFVQKCGIY